MSNPYAVYQTDTNLEVSGVWLVEEDFRVKIARAGGANEKYNKRSTALIKPHKRAIDLGVFPKDMDEKLTRQLYIETVVLEWEVLDREKTSGEDRVYHANSIRKFPTGEIIPFTREACDEVLKNATELMRYLMGQANDVSVFRGQTADEAEEDVKN